MSKLKLSVIEQRVYDLIQKYPYAANDDAALLDLYWSHYDEEWDYSKSRYWNLKRSTRPETISKRRRDLHRWGLITYSNEAHERREEAYLQEKENAGVKPTLKAVPWNY